MSHWKRLLAARRKITQELRHRLIAHRKAGERAPRLERAYRRWKALTAQAQRGLRRAQRPAAGPTVMYDNVTLSLIPDNPPAVASYVNGRYANNSVARRMYPKARHLSIAVTANADADCLDIETGDAVPAQGPAWVRRQIARGIKRPVVYANRSTMPQVIAHLRNAGIRREQVRLWCADYTFHPHWTYHTWGGVLTQADAVQWTDRSHGRSLDESILKPDFFA